MSWGDMRPQTAAASSRWITNPKHLNKIAVFQNRLTLKSTQTTSVDSSIAGFFTALALRGAQTSIASANAFVTVANIAGSGFMVNAVSPQHSATATPTIRITVDGTIYTLTPSAAIGATTRLVLGPILPSASIVAVSTASVAADIPTPNASADNGFVNASVGGVCVLTIGATGVSIPTPESALSFNLQCLRFEQSLKVEMACDNLSGVAVDKQCGVTYMLDL